MLCSTMSMHWAQFGCVCSLPVFHLIFTRNPLHLKASVFKVVYFYSGELLFRNGHFHRMKWKCQLVYILMACMHGFISKKIPNFSTFEIWKKNTHKSTIWNNNVKLPSGCESFFCISMIIIIYTQCNNWHMKLHA